MIGLGDMLFVIVLVYIVSKTTSKFLTFIPSAWFKKSDKGDLEE